MFVSRSYSGYHIAFSYVSLVSCKLWQFSILYIFFMTLTILMSTGQLFCGLSDVFQQLDWSYAVLGKNTAKIIFCPQWILETGYICFQYVLLLVISTFELLLKWCLLGFSTVVTIFPFSIDKYLGRDTLSLCKYPVSPQVFQWSISASSCNNYYCGDCQMVSFYSLVSFYIY